MNDPQVPNKRPNLIRLAMALSLIIIVVAAFGTSLWINANNKPPEILDNTKWSISEIHFQRLLPNLLGCETDQILPNGNMRLIEKVWNPQDEVIITSVVSAQRATYSLDYMHFESRFTGLAVLANLAVPSSPAPEGGFPAVVFLHGLRSNPDILFSQGKVDYHNAIGRRLAERGYVVITPYTYNQLTWRSKAEAFYNLREVDLANTMTSIDLLIQLDIIDEDKIVVYGISQGASTARIVGAVDDRVDLLVLNGRHSSPYDYMRDRGILAEGIHPQSFEQYPPCEPRILNEFILGAPRPLILEYSHADSQAYGINEIYVLLKEYDPEWVITMATHKSGHAINPNDTTLEIIDLRLGLK